MIRLVVGGKGEGKTKILLDNANEAIKIANGNIVFIDKSAKHMYELNNKVRLINASNLPLKNTDQFLGALCGMISQDHDLEKVYLDNFLKIALADDAAVNEILEECESISNSFNVEFIIGLSVSKDALNEKLQSMIMVEC